MNPEPPSIVLIACDELSRAERYAARLESEHDVHAVCDVQETLDRLTSSVAVLIVDDEFARRFGSELLTTVDSMPAIRLVLVERDPLDDAVIERCDTRLRRPLTDGELRDAVERMIGRVAYDVKLEQYFRLASKAAAIQTNAEHSATLELCTELRSMQTELDELLSRLPAEDGYIVATRSTSEVGTARSSAN